MNIVEALHDRRLFGALPAFADLSTWSSWIVVLKAVYGLPLDAREVEVFRRFTGRRRYEPPAGGWREVVLCVGRQAGKSRIAGLIGAWEAVRPTERGGSGQYAVILAQDRTAALRALAGYAFEPFDAESGSLFAGAARSRTVDTVTLDSGVTLACYPCRPSSVRGIRARVVLLDELDFMTAGPDARDIGRDVLRAARPCLATTHGRLIVLSSPGGRPGSAFHELVTQHFGVEDSPVLVVRAPAPDLNPALGAEYLERMKSDDYAFRTEVLGEWVEGGGQLFDGPALAACVVAGRRELPPEAASGAVRAFVDPAAGARGGDRFALALGWREGQRVVVGALRAWDPPFSPRAVVGEVADLCRQYGVRKVEGDRFGGAIVEELFREAGLQYEAVGRTSSDLFLDAVTVVQSGGLELPDPALSRLAAEVIADLRSVVRRPGGGDRPRAEAPRGSGRHGHADLGNAVVGLISALPARRAKPAFAPPVVVEMPRGRAWFGGEDEVWSSPF